MRKNETEISDIRPWSRAWLKIKSRGFKTCLQEHSLRYTLVRAFGQFAEYSEFGRLLYRFFTAIRQSVPVSFAELAIRYVFSVMAGFSAYKKIIRLEGTADKPIYFMDYSGTGDTY